MQECAKIIDLENPAKNMYYVVLFTKYLQKSVLIQPRMSLSKFHEIREPKILERHRHSSKNRMRLWPSIT